MKFPENVFSKEILLIIRDYLMEMIQSSLGNESSYELKLVLRKERLQNWRNFLYCRNSCHWKQMRKETNFLELNQFYSLKYLRDQIFKDDLLQRIVNPRYQLSLQLRNIYPYKFHNLSSSVIQDLFAIDLSVNMDIDSISTIRNVGHIDLKYSSSVTPIEIEGKIDSLSIAIFQGLIFDQISSNITTLIGITSDAFNPFEFPLLIELQLLVVTESVADFFDEAHFPNLKHLSVSHIDGLNIVLPPFRLPKLSWLIAGNATVEDISECISLQSFQLQYGTLLRGHHILKQLKTLQLQNYTLHSYDFDFLEFPTLRSLSLDSSSALLSSSSLRNYYHVPELSISCNEEIVQLPLTKNVKRLFIRIASSLHTIEGLSSDPAERHAFQYVEAMYTSLSDYSIFANTQVLVLQACISLIDISPFQNVPYLDLGYCNGITDFSPLGKQRYLNLCDCSQLRDQDLDYLSEVDYSNISRCGQLTDLSALKKNKRVVAEACEGLKYVILLGEKYLVVNLNFCINLEGIECIQQGASSTDRVIDLLRLVSVPRMMQLDEELEAMANAVELSTSVVRPGAFYAAGVDDSDDDDVDEEVE